MLILCATKKKQGRNPVPGVRLFDERYSSEPTCVQHVRRSPHPGPSKLGEPCNRTARWYGAMAAPYQDANATLMHNVALKIHKSQGLLWKRVTRNAPITLPSDLALDTIN